MEWIEPRGADEYRAAVENLERMIFEALAMYHEAAAEDVGRASYPTPGNVHRPPPGMFGRR